MSRMAAKLAGMGNALATKGPKLATGLVEWSTPRLRTFWYYARVELVPPKPSEFPAVQKGLQDVVASARTGKWKNVTVRQAWLNTLIAMEICFWFFVGEQIGRRSVVGYNVKLAVEPPKHSPI
ncbi:ATP synthase subunit g, mitochondrial-like [Ptychodera flava]|uniref:ATP synthase subunit g, mitochondrial-like n=1 Tax=Ptychodera flava TaxID=63121 RepID=UPI00396A1E22